LILARAIELGIVNQQTWAGLTRDDIYWILLQGARDQISNVLGQLADPEDKANQRFPYSGDTHDGWGLIDIDASLEYLEANYCPNPPC